MAVGTTGIATWASLWSKKSVATPARLSKYSRRILRNSNERRSFTQRKLLPPLFQGIVVRGAANKRGSKDEDLLVMAGDTHQSSGRHFVRDVLTNLAKDLNGVDKAEEAERPDLDEEDGGPDEDRVDIDHDTLGVGGSPRIADTILRKIEQAAVFVADVTPVGKTPGGKHLPNPNVMIELGYALRVMELERIVPVMNCAEGAALKNLPFDLRHWRAPVNYSLSRDAGDDRVEVANQLKDDLRRVIQQGLWAAAKASASETDVLPTI